MRETEINNILEIVLMVFMATLLLVRMLHDLVATIHASIDEINATARAKEKALRRDELRAKAQAKARARARAEANAAAIAAAKAEVDAVENTMTDAEEITEIIAFAKKAKEDFVSRIEERLEEALERSERLRTALERATLERARLEREINGREAELEPLVENVKIE